MPCFVREAISMAAHATTTDTQVLSAEKGRTTCSFLQPFLWGRCHRFVSFMDGKLPLRITEFEEGSFLLSVFFIDGSSYNYFFP